MRMRKKKHTRERLEAVSDYIFASPERTAEFREESKLPCELEIGCGKGDFAIEMQSRTGRPFIAFEKCEEALMIAAEKAKRAECANLHFIIGDATHIDEWFQPGDVSVLYLNFSDPWPKTRHAKYRLTCRTFLAKFKALLAPGGAIIFKTDNRPFFDYSLDEFAAAGFELRNLTYDLHASEWNEDNIETEYERNFSAKGFKINRVEAYPIDMDKPQA